MTETETQHTGETHEPNDDYVDLDGVDAERSATLTEDDILRIEFAVRSVRPEPIRVAIREPLPAGVPPERVGFHADYGREHWSIDDGVVVHETDLEPRGDLRTIYAVKRDGTTDPAAFAAGTRIDVEPRRDRPTAVATDEPTTHGTGDTTGRAESTDEPTPDAADHGLTGLEARLQRTERELDERLAAVEARGERLEEMSDRLDDTGERVESLDDGLAVIEGRHEAAVERLDDADERFESLAEDLAALRSRHEESVERVDRNGDALRAASDRLDALEAEHAAETETLEAAVETVADEVDEIRRWHRDFGRLLDDFAAFTPRDVDEPAGDVEVLVEATDEEVADEFFGDVESRDESADEPDESVDETMEEADDSVEESDGSAGEFGDSGPAGDELTGD